MNPSHDYEPGDASPRAVLATAVGIALMIAACMLASSWVLGNRPVRPDPAQSFRHGPVERTSIARYWAAQDAAVKNHLENYAWVDRSAGVVRVPVDRGIELAAPEPAKNSRESKP
ncbi:MAG: hypothetical protein JWM32_792 [Verrucomicrobia bacterium]|nr:hypothetical protein [Verrucomicrobiota bacterium]